MNRLSIDANTPASSPAATAQVSQPLARIAERRATPHSLLTPMHYEPGYAYPLVIWLHSDGGDEHEVETVMPLVSERNYVAVGLRGTDSRGKHRGYKWTQDFLSIHHAQQRMFDAVEQATERYNINQERVFIAGYGCGGTMALRLALQFPNLFAGAVSLGGSFPRGTAPLANLEQARKLPMMIAHARDSRTYTVDHLCDELRLFHAAGLAMSLRQYPCGDELTTQMLHDFDVWMMEQVTGMSSTSDNSMCEMPGDHN
ncbi:phospholipase/Carboxylesterase [Pirellula staleyi DSM 6068]|uniref:Phospholipase/Carboxylesterase n=1 Tax=Pirellula staleyi (strain ATCC 27377 / DSM 6068 / ICPB 4128) TaxID=530564 RepID=D2R517_PIRSD|nr:alpha/beta hydrolase-fold protein [Pirellula staleyi]ADB18979.1 phospholipase/Carboxylesterase [Pirellula staleyi DSM 6068]